MDQSLRSHFRKGADHWNRFIETYDGDKIDFSGGTFKSNQLDLSGYCFPIPVSFNDCEFQGIVRLEECEFEAWVSFQSANFQKTLIIKETEFRGEVDFESARFKDSLIIDESVFSFDAKFDDVDVLGRFYVTGCQFSGDVILSDLGAYGGLVLSNDSFKKEVSFSGQFEKETLLLSNKFDGFVDFGYAHFKAPLILRGNTFASRPAIDNVRLSYTPMMPGDHWFGGRPEIGSYQRFLDRIQSKSKWLAGFMARALAVAKTDNSYPTLRQFRSFAREYDDFRLALEIYSLEQKSRRIWFDSPFSGSFIFGLLFQLLSDFGRSTLRPFLVLVANFSLFSILFSVSGSSQECDVARKIGSGIIISLNNSLPFLSWQKQSILAAAETCLFNQGSVGMPFAVLSILQVLVSAILIFLVGLGIRNSLKMHS